MSPKGALGWCFIISCLFLKANGLIVTQFNCTSCTLQQILYPYPTVVLAMLSDWSVYRSVDEGQHWTKVASNMQYMGSYDSSPNTILFVDFQLRFYSSTDGGATIVSGSIPNNIGGRVVIQITPHPNTVGWLFIVHCTNNAAYSPCTVSYSKNLGQSWVGVFSNQLLPYYVWWSPSTYTPDIIFGVRVQSNSFGYFMNFSESQWNTLFTNSIGSVMTNHYMFVGVGAGSGADLYASSSRWDSTHADPSKYHLAEFPFGDVLPERGYTFLDDSTRSEFLAVQRTSNTSWGTLFSSEFDGDSYTLSLPYIASVSLYYDFDSFKGLPGIFLANAYPNASSAGKRTLITFDNGGDWRPLTPPAYDANGNRINCQLSQGCSLHLHGLTSWYFGWIPPYYTSPNAVGIIVAIGNTGNFVSTSSSDLNTYISRDAGLTWTELFDGATIYEIGDHGGILVFATIVAATNKVYFSLDEGLSYTTYQFTQGAAIWVDNIITEPSGTGRKFILLGTTTGGNSVIYGLDFSDLYIQNCTDSDYENWQVSDGEHGDSSCFMGSATTYQRRRRSAQCYNNRDTDHVVSSTPCTCAFEDYECDIGYAPSARNATDGFTCTLVGNFTTPCENPLTGYRLIPDTTCTLTGGLDLTSHCYSTSSTSASTSTSSSSSSAVTTSSSAVTTSSSAVTTSSSAVTTSSSAVTTSSSSAVTTSSSAVTTSSSAVSTSSSAVTTSSSSTTGSSSSSTSSTIGTGFTFTITAYTTATPPSSSSSTGGSAPTSTSTTSSGSVTKPGSHAGAVAAVTILVILVAIGGSVGVLYWRHDRFREYVNEKLETLRSRRGGGSQTYAIVNQDEEEGGI